jgi:hypothetical protein
MRITTAWQRISPEVTVRGFKECCISNTMVESDDMLWIGRDEDGNVRSKTEEDEGTDCGDGDRLIG